jgi:hypothetical protein
MKKIKTAKKKNRKVGRQGSPKANRRASVKSTADPKKIIRFGEVVYSLFWDSGAPGPGAEYESVFKWRDNYAVCLSFDEPQGPYNSLARAVKAAELNRVTEATVSIDSQELSSEQIAEMLRYFGEPPFGLRINGEVWLVNEKKKFVRKVDEDHS